jgi:hypothetical protein
MTISWYSIYISLSPEGNRIFNGYFSVDNTTNVVQSFYETIDNVTNFTNKILLAVDTYSVPYSTGYPLKNNNIFEAGFFTDNGTLIGVTQFSFYDIQVIEIGLHNTVSSSEYLAFISEDDSKPTSDYRYFTTLLAYDPSSVCFNEGTKILCLNKELLEEYIRIENLRKGDIVKSYKHGYRRIELIGKNHMINNKDKFWQCMYKMEKTKENGLIEDLIVTGGHSILVDDLEENKEENEKIFKGTQMIDDKYLLLSAVSKDFKKLENNNLYIYYHFILENDGNNEARYGVWANGILTETPNKNFFMGQKFTLLENK